MIVRHSGFAVGAAAALMCVASSASAATQCVGQIKSMLVDTGGNVMIFTTFRSDWIQICSTLGPWKGIPAELCKQWLGVATAARVSGELFSIRYTADMACNAIPTYTSAPASEYIALWD